MRRSTRRSKPSSKNSTNQRRKPIADWQLELLRQHYPEQTRSRPPGNVARTQDRRQQPHAAATDSRGETAASRELLPDDQQPAAVLEARQSVADIEHEIQEDSAGDGAAAGRFARCGTGANRRRRTSCGAANTINRALVGPGVPSVLTDGQTPFDVEPPFRQAKTGRRLAFARWLTRPDHPLTARVMVNRIWYHHFGTGLVAIAGELWRQRRTALASGTAGLAGGAVRQAGLEHQGDAPADDEFPDLPAVEPHHGRPLRTIDPQNRLLSRMPLRRMNAEALRDSLLFVSGKLDDTAGRAARLGDGRPQRAGQREPDRDGRLAAEYLSAVPPHRNSRRCWRRSTIPKWAQLRGPQRIDCLAAVADADEQSTGPRTGRRPFAAASGNEIAR